MFFGEQHEEIFAKSESSYRPAFKVGGIIGSASEDELRKEMICVTAPLLQSPASELRRGGSATERPATFAC
jgi:hypothetical protein